MAEVQYQSKAFQSGGMVRLMDFAVRGLPRSFMPDQRPVDVDWAKTVFGPELLLLDSLDLHMRWFWSGTIGAALISLALWPQTIELWRRLAELTVYRDETGPDGPCLLFELIERHQLDPRLTRRPDFQLYVFQSAMAVAEAWAFGDPTSLRLASLPPVPDVPGLIERVRKHKGAAQRGDGFLARGVLSAHWYLQSAPKFTHDDAVDKAVALAMEAAALEENLLSPARLRHGVGWLRDQQLEPALCHPAALAAALVTIALDESTRDLWQAALAGQGRRHPHPGHKPLVDAAMRINDCITAANRSAWPQEDAPRLYHRCLQCVKGWQADPDRLWMGLPRITEATLTAYPLWKHSGVAFAPRLRFGRERPIPPLKTFPLDGEKS